MKYTVEGYSQEKAIELGLNIEDLIILRWIQDFYPLMIKKIINDEEYVWINYSKLLEDLPILSFKSKRSLIRRLEKFEELELLKRECIKNEDGTYSYIMLTTKIGILISNKNYQKPTTDGVTQETYGYDMRDTGRMTPVSYQNNPSTINNPSTKINKEKKSYGEFANVLLTDEQYKKLSEIYCQHLSEAIETLSTYIESSGKKYKSHYAVLGKHNWVYKKLVEEEKERNKRNYY
jgi:hypothetical protein